MSDANPKASLPFPLPLEAPQIRELLPHRYPMLLIDRVTELVPRKSVTAIKCVTQNEPFFQGHFPARPIMPGVLMVEAIAQTGAICVLVDPEYRGRMAVLAGLSDVKFRRMVVPGDVLTLKVELTALRKSYGRARGVALVGDEVAVEGSMQFGILD